MKQEAVNPFLPLSEYHPDGEPHVFGDRVYLFASHDEEGGSTFCALDYVFWSAPADDLSDWTCRDVSYSAEQDPLCGESARYMYAPDCVQGADGRYYLYYCLSGEKGRGGYSHPISVAVCDTPDGKYEYLGFVRNRDGSPFTERVCFDPAVINDSGTIRLYFGTSMPWLERIRPKSLRRRVLAKAIGRTPAEAAYEDLGAYHVTLADDMLTVTSKPVRIDDTITGTEYPKHPFFEGSSIRKIGKTYYFIYSSTNNHELCYATSCRPDGDYHYGGTIVSNGDIGYEGRRPEDRLNHTGTNHGSIEQVGGKWYVFYHRLTHNSDYSRQACAEEIRILPDGSIPQVEITSCGLNDGPLRFGAYPAAICCNLTHGRMSHGSNSDRKRKEPCITDRNGERFITGITEGTEIVYKYFLLDGPARLTITARGDGGTFETNLGARIEVKPAADWSLTCCELPAHEGSFPLRLIYHGRGMAELRDIELQRV